MHFCLTKILYVLIVHDWESGGNERPNVGVRFWLTGQKKLQNFVLNSIIVYAHRD